MSRILDILFLIFSNMGLLYLKLLSKKNIKENTIAAFPYYSKNWPGGEERIGYWKNYFENDGYSFDVFWASDTNEFLQLDSTKNIFRKYWIYYKILFRRIASLKKALSYSSIWIQRSYIPFYPYKDAYFEKAISKKHSNVILDFYDADYMNNFNLIINAVKSVNKISASTPFLVDYFKKYNPNSFLLQMTIENHLYLPSQKKNTEVLKIGWMGSPANAQHLLHLKETLKEIEDSFNIEYHFVCRDFPYLDLNKITISRWEDDFDYKEWINTIDIGIVPYFGESDILKAKSSMKTIEFMSCKIPIIASQWGALDKMVNNVDFLLAETTNIWKEKLSILITDKALREKIGTQGNKTFHSYYTYDSQLNTLKKILLD